MLSRGLQFVRHQLDSPPGGSLWSGLLAAVVLFGAYLGTYYATVVPYVQKLGPGYYYSLAGHQLPYAMYDFFAPAHWLDCQLRREPWATQATGQTRPWAD